MSISIVKDGKLWGLIACHHREAKIVAQPVRITCEVLARVFSSHIAMAEEEDARAHVTALLALTARIEERMRKDRDVVAALALVGDDVATVIGAQGCAFIIRGEIVLLGITPTRLQVEGLSTWLGFNQREHLFSTERMSAVYERAKEFDTVASGLLSLRIALGSPDFVLWFRPSITHVITWGEILLSRLKKRMRASALARAVPLRSGSRRSTIAPNSGPRSTGPLHPRFVL